MVKLIKKLYWQFISIALTLSYTTFFSSGAIAQIVPDKTLGIDNSTVTPNTNIKGVPSDLINAGTVRGANLFHSFQEFNVREGRGAYFSNPIGIENIFSRVTGGNPSNILGRLGVLGNANLFFINPNGIIFGANASLDISGSFLGSTANSFNFSDGSQFSARNPNAAPLLSVSVPLGVQFNNQPSAIINSGNLSTGQNLALMGGTVASTGQLSAPSGQVAVVAAPPESVVNLSSSAQLTNINTPTVVGSAESPSRFSSLTGLITESDAQIPGLTINSNGQVELAGSRIPIKNGDIVVRNVTAQTATLTANNDLTLVESLLGTDGDLNLFARNTFRVRDSIANPFIARAGKKLLVQGNQGIDIFALNHPGSGLVAGGDIVLRSNNAVGGDARYWTGGNYRIEKLDGSLGGLFSPYDPVIRASGDVSFDSYTGASLHIFAGGSVTIPGTVEITGGDATNGIPVESVALSDGTSITINSVNPTLDIRAGTTEFNPVGQIPNPISGIQNLTGTNQPTSANIRIGSIINTIVNGQVFLTNQYSPNLNLPGGSIELTNGIADPQAPNLGPFSIRAYGNPVTIDARGDVRITQGIVTGTGNSIGGNVNIISEGSINTTGANIVSRSNGLAGNITLKATGDIRPGNIEASSNQNETSNSNFNKINIHSSQGNVFIIRAKLDTTNTASGFAGDIVINGKMIVIEKSDIESEGVVGRVFIGRSAEDANNVNANNVSISNSRINIKTIPGIESSLSPIQNQGININSLGDIKINNSIFTATTNSSIPPGSINLDARGIVNITNSQIENTVSPNANVQQVDDYTPTINIKGSSINIIEKSEVDAATFGQGDAGNVSINARDNVILDNSRIFTTVEEKAQGNAGKISIEIETASLSIRDGGQLQALTRGQGNAGEIKITAKESVNISGTSSSSGHSSALFTNTESSGTGGNIIIKASNLTVSEGAILNAESKSSGNAGFITVEADRIELLNGGQIFSSTSGTGSAGTITVNAKKRVTVRGSDATFEQRRRNFPIETIGNIVNDELGRILTNKGDSNGRVDSGFFVHSTSSEKSAGDILVNSPIVFLDSRGRLIADSNSVNGGNINLNNGNLLLMRRNALISTTTGRGQLGGGSGGNIKIDYPDGFIIAGFRRNNDITANAFAGRGGEVKINAPGGAVNMQALKKEDLQRLLAPRELDAQLLPTNDITAVSQEGGPNLQGTVNLNAPNVDPTRGTMQLPEDLGDSSRLITQACPVGVQSAASRFVITGRGGLPANPASALSHETFFGNAANTTTNQNATASTSVIPREAQSVEIGSRGEIILTARPSAWNNYTPWQKLRGCNAE